MMAINIIKTRKKRNTLWINCLLTLIFLAIATVTPSSYGAVIFHEGFEGVESDGDTRTGGRFLAGYKGMGWQSTVDEPEAYYKEFFEYPFDGSLLGKEGTIEFYVKRDHHHERVKQESVLEFLDKNHRSIISILVLWNNILLEEEESAVLVYGHDLIEKMASTPWGGELFSLGEEITDGWHHVAVTWGMMKDDFKIYFNGMVLKNPKTKFGRLYKPQNITFQGLLANTAYIRIGAEAQSRDPETTYSPLSNSVIDELKIHDVAFNPYIEAKKPVITSITDNTFSVPGISGKITTGDMMHVRLEAEAGGTASFDMGIVTGVPMAEVVSDTTGEGTGVYEGSYTVKPGDDYEDGHIVGHFISAAGVEADPVSASNRWTIDTGTNLALEIDKTDLPADEAAKTKIKVTVSDVNGEPVRDHRVRIDLSTTGEYTGLVGVGDFRENVGAEVEATWKSVTDSWGEVDFDYRSGFAAKTVIVTAKDLTTGSVGVGYITSYIDALIDIALTAPVSKAAARRGILYYMDVEASRAELTADGRSRSVIRAYVYDPNGNPVEGDTVEFTLDQENGVLRTIKAVTDKNGRATAEYRAGKKIGIVQVTATNVTRGLTGYVSITLLSDAPAKIYLAARPESLPADGFSRSDVEVRVTDINDNPNEDTEVLFSLVKGSGEIRKDLLVTDRFGEATNAFVSGKEPGLATIKATVKSKIPTEEELDMARNVLFATYSDLDDEMRLEKWLVRKGDAVKEGDPLCRYSIRGENFMLTAPCDLEIKELLAESWDYLEVGQTLATVIPINGP